MNINKNKTTFILLRIIYHYNNDHDHIVRKVINKSKSY